jgi:hypothetical protein
LSELTGMADCEAMMSLFSKAAHVAAVESGTKGVKGKDVRGATKVKKALVLAPPNEAMSAADALTEIVNSSGMTFADTGLDGWLIA